MQILFDKGYIDSEELNTLLQQREAGKVDFVLVDVREDMEFGMGHIKGVDMLKPTTVFQQWAQVLFNETKDKTVIFTCRTGSRSEHVQNAFKQHGHKGVLNHFGGIVTYRGAIER